MSTNTTLTPVQDTFIFELSGEHESLPKAEILACFEAQGTNNTIQEEDLGILVIRAEDLDISILKDRLALTHQIDNRLFSCEVDEILSLKNSFEIPEGSFAVRAKRIQRKHEHLDIKEVERIVAQRIKSEGTVDLENPDIEVRVIISERCHIGLKLAGIDRNSFEKRKVQFRPFFSPVSLHPRLARVLVNLSRIKKEQSLLDPFCGTGGILIEASQIGARSIGSDIDERMIAGSSENLKTFNINDVELFRADISEVSHKVEKVDAIATDPPYGRSATTNREEISSLYHRAFATFSEILKNGGYLSIALPHEELIRTGEGYMSLIETHTMRVHRSLTRNFCVFKKE
jgi:tRNA (guanine10-N2)-dimethyltransferase